MSHQKMVIVVAAADAVDANNSSDDINNSANDIVVAVELFALAIEKAE
jgi:hypothetical protein